ncbi:hypothetical protein Tco_1161894, partial [Tanacetum coccineum]
SDFGRYRVMLDFENSVLHLPSAEEDLRKLSGSVETQGESSSMNFRRKSGFTEYGSSSQVTEINAYSFVFCAILAVLLCISRKRKRRKVSLRCGKSGPANPASTKLTKSQERKTPETSTEAINKPLKRTLFPDESMEHKKQKNPNGKVVHFTSTVAQCNLKKVANITLSGQTIF